MKSPSQALAWSTIYLSWPVLLTQIVGAVSIIFLISLSLDPEIDSTESIHIVDFVLIASLVFLYSVVLSKKQRAGNATAGLGFPYTTEFSLPVSTLTLLVVPLLCFCALTQVAIFVPGLIVNLLVLDAEVSVFPISFLVFQYTIIPLMLTWWTQNGLASIAGWLIALILYMNGLLIPEFTRMENSWVLVTESSSSYIVSLFFTAVLILIAYFGVKQQRSGELLLNFGNGRAMLGDTQHLRSWMPLPTPACPTSSAIRAEIWKERQLHGEYNALFGGLAGVAATFTILSIIQFFVPGANIPKFSNVVVLAMGMYVAVCTSLIVTLFGVRYKNGVANVSVHDKTTPLNTAQLTLIRTSVTLGSTLIAGLVMAVSIWFFGPYFINDFAEMRALILEFLQTLSELGIASVTLRVVLILFAFLTGLLLYATFLTWFMLQSKKMSIGLLLISAYIFLVATGLSALFGNLKDSYVLQASVFQSHLWIVIFFIPTSIIIMSRSLLKNGVISAKGTMLLAVMALLVQVLNLTWLFGANNYDVLQLDISAAHLSYLSMQGFLPLLAAIFALWTSDRIRHG